MGVFDPKLRYQNATDQLGRIHGPLPHEQDKGGRFWLWIVLCGGVLLLAGVIVLTIVVGD